MLEFLGSYLGVITGVIMVILLLVILASGYVKSPSDTVFIISGLRRETIIGKASVKIPFLKRLDELSLELISIDVKASTTVPTADYIGIQVGAVVSVKVSNDPERLVMATENLLNQNAGYMGRVAKEMLEGSTREIVGHMKLEEMVSDHQKPAELAKENATLDLATIGLDTISFNVQNLSGNDRVIDGLGIGNIFQVKKKATIAKAEADKEIAVVKAETDRQANDAKINSDHEIAIKNNELNIQKAELEKSTDAKQAEVDATYQIREEQQRKATEITTAEANVAKQEKETIIKQRVAEVVKKTLGAEVRKKVEADKYARQQKAETELCERQKDAEAKKFGMQQEAEAQRSGVEAEWPTREQEAQDIRMVGDAGAEAVRAKDITEVEAMEKKAKAYQKYTGAAVVEIMTRVLPEVVGRIVEPLVQTDKITIVGNGLDNSGVNNVANDATTMMAKLFESVKEIAGIDLGEIVKASTYDAKVNRNIHVIEVLEGDVIGKEIVENTIEDSAQ